jgi:2'-5' RNA ligase
VTELMRYVRFSATSSSASALESRGASSDSSSSIVAAPPPRWETYQGISHLVIPVVALLGDIAIFPMGAECYELVPSMVLNSAPMAWNGHPILADHPNDGESGACAPEILSRDQFGVIFNSRYDDDSQSLQMEAWLNPERAKAVGQDAIDVFDQCAAGETLEISVGAYIRLIEAHGVARNGREYELAWTLIHPDHLAIGLRGKEGACSIEEGCGTNRALVNADGTHKYSSAQVNLPESIVAKVIDLGKSIPDELIVESEGGREDNPHATVKYGLHDESADNLIALLEEGGLDSITLTLGDLAAFEADTYDVLYASVDSPDLIRVNELITSRLEVTNTQSSYIPHVTIAYVTKGSASQYVGNSVLTGLQVIISEIVFSGTDKSKTIIQLPIGSQRETEMGTDAKASAASKPVKNPADPLKPVKPKTNKSGVVAQFLRSFRSLMSSTDQAEEAAELIGYELMKSMSDSVKSTMAEMDTLINQLIAGETESPTETMDAEAAEEIMENAQLQAIRAYCFTAYSTIGAILDQAGMMRATNQGYYDYAAGDPPETESRAAAGKRNSKTDQATIQKVHDHAVALGAGCSSDNVPKNMSSGTQKSPCGCAKLSNATDRTDGTEDGEMAIEKEAMKALMGRLLSGKGTPEDAALIKAEFGVEAPKEAALATASVTPVAAATTPAKPAKTEAELEAEYLASAPPSVRNMVERAKATEAEARAGMIRQLTAAQTHYDEKALAAMDTNALAGLVTVLKLNDPPARVNYLGLGLPQPGGAAEDEAAALKVYGAPPSGIEEYASASRGEKAKAN